MTNQPAGRLPAGAEREATMSYLLYPLAIALTAFGTTLAFV